MIIPNASISKAESIFVKWLLINVAIFRLEKEAYPKLAGLCKKLQSENTFAKYHTMMNLDAMLWRLFKLKVPKENPFNLN